MQTRFLPIWAAFLLVLNSAGTAFAQQDMGNGQYPGPGNASGGPSQFPAYGGAPPQSYGKQLQQFGTGQQFVNQQQPTGQVGSGAAAPNRGGYPQPGAGQPAMNSTAPQGAPKKLTAQQSAQVFHWFIQYDEVRRRAQMNPIERQQADGLLARGFSLFMPGQDKVAAKQLLTNLVNKYQGATQSIKALHVLPETKQLQLAYYQYFESAMNLFADYLRVQDNIFAVDSTGQAIAKQLLQRKLALEQLEHNCKMLDTQMRQHYGIGAYQY
jgi:hypothetical protein